MFDEKSLENLVRQKIAGEVLANISQEDINALLVSQIESIIKKMDYWSLKSSLEPVIQEKLDKILEDKKIQEAVEKKCIEYLNFVLPTMVESMIKSVVGIFSDKYGTGKTQVADAFIKAAREKFGSLDEIDSL